MLVNLGPLGSQTPLGILLSSAGAFLIGYVLYTVGKFVLSTLVIPGKAISSFGPKGSWALITGASDGVGKEYATQLAAAGYNVILASRTQSKLDTLSSQITTKFPNVKVETIAIDFSVPTSSDYASLSSLLSGKQLAVLINNVGQSHNVPVSFAETPLPEMNNIIQVNCLATLRVTQIALPHMLPHKRGLILTMGSFGGLTPTPLLATYSGSKAFLQQWSTALATELEPEGITVHFVHAYLITSAMSKVRRTTWQIPSEKDFVQAALSKIGNQGGSVGYTFSGTPYWSHSLAAFIMLAIYGSMNKKLLRFNRKMHVNIRKKALAKIEREKAKGKKDS